MNTILGFVPSLLGFVSNGLTRASDGVGALKGLADKNPRQSGVLAIVLGWLGLDPGAVSQVGDWLMAVGLWLQ
jgi:hypothetical protein